MQRVGDWILFSCGDIVRDEADERHYGKVISIWNAYLVKVKWEETGWISLLPISRLLKVEEP